MRLAAYRYQDQPGVGRLAMVSASYEMEATDPEAEVYE